MTQPTFDWLVCSECEAVYAVRPTGRLRGPGGFFCQVCGQDIFAWVHPESEDYEFTLGHYRGPEAPMTEAEWAACDDPRELLDYHRMKRDPRRLRLLAVACARLITPNAFPAQLVSVLDVAERYADGTTDRAEFLVARRAVRAVNRQIDEFTPTRRILMWLADDSLEAQSMAITMTRELSGPGGAAAECNLSRCAFGNPFRSIAFDPAWRTETVIGLAAGIATDRAFDRLPILADALEDAGCADPDVLAHCRGSGPHALCCWVVDGLLGK